MTETRLYNMINSSAPAPAAGFADVLARIERQRNLPIPDDGVTDLPVRSNGTGRGLRGGIAAAVTVAVVGAGAAGVALLANSGMKSEDAAASFDYAYEAECSEAEGSFSDDEFAADVSESDVSATDEEMPEETEADEP